MPKIVKNSNPKCKKRINFPIFIKFMHFMKCANLNPIIKLQLCKKGGKSAVAAFGPAIFDSQ